MKLAMRLPEKGRQTEIDSDPRESETTEVIDLASRTAYPVVSQRKGRSDALGLAAGVGFVMVLGAATLWGLNASRMADEGQPAAAVPAPVVPGPALAPALAPGDVPLVNAVPGAPVTDPPGNAACSKSIGPHSARSRPLTTDTRCCTNSYRSSPHS